MRDTDEIRWRQRLENFCRALARLEDACGREQYSELEQAGLVQTFAFSFELAWKTLKDLLFYEGYDEKTPRDVIRRAFEAGHLSQEDTETALDALGKRNLLSHTYDEESAEEAVALIRENYAPMLLRLRDTLLELRDRG